MEKIFHIEKSLSKRAQIGKREVFIGRSLAGMEGFSEVEDGTVGKSLRPDCRAPRMLSRLAFVLQVRKSC